MKRYRRRGLSHFRAVFGRQHAGHERDAADEIALQHLSEARDAIRQHDTVDAVLDVRVFIANVEEPAGRRVLGYTRRLQQHPVHGRVAALWYGLYRLLGEIVRVGPNLGEQIGARLIEGFALCRKRLSRRCGGCSAGRRLTHVKWLFRLRRSLPSRSFVCDLFRLLAWASLSDNNDGRQFAPVACPFGGVVAVTA
jgi:hypothetical protein